MINASFGAFGFPTRAGNEATAVATAVAAGDGEDSMLKGVAVGVSVASGVSVCGEVSGTGVTLLATVWC